MIYAVAMSGGVDSSVAAYLLKEQGHQVLGFTMRHFDDTNPIFKQNSISKAIEDAKKVCEILAIDHYTINLEKDFLELIISDMINEYRNGYTPNPCTLCNPIIKWGKFPEQIALIIKEKFNCDDFRIATGHYALKRYISGKSALYRPIDKHKDQTYMLWRLSSDQLDKTDFPLSAYSKAEIRKIAQKASIPVAEKKDSQDICFISDKYMDFIKHYVTFEKGDIIFHDGSLIGEHQGLASYTIGQRKGLVPWSKPLYVLKIDSKLNQLIVTDDQTKLESSKFSIKNINFIREAYPIELKDLQVKIRYNSIEEPVKSFSIDDNIGIVELVNPLKAITPGQSAVFYRHDELVGGGIIDQIL